MQQTDTPEGISDAEERAARQARLSKALSAAYLSHQITQLEDRVQGVGIGQAPRGGRGQRRTEGRRSPSGAGRGGKGPSMGRGGGNRQRNDEPRRTSAGLAPPSGRLDLVDNDEDEIIFPEGESPRLVLDTSALLFALPTLKHLLHPPTGTSGKHPRHQHGHSDGNISSGGGAELIVPLESLRTLDLLKKGMHPYSTAARAATRFVENEQRRTVERLRAETSRQGTDKGKEKDRSHTQERLGEEVGEDGWRKIRPGLWVQKDTERTDVFPSDRLIVGDSELVDNDHQIPPSEQQQQQEEEPLAPGYITETLSCALYFREWWDVPSSQPVLAIAHPRSSGCSTTNAAAGTESGMRGGRVGEGEEMIERYAERAEGWTVRDWAERGDVVFLDLSASRGGGSHSNGGERTEPRTAAHLRGERVQDEGYWDQEEARVVRLASVEDDPRAEIVHGRRDTKSGKQQQQRNRRRPQVPDVHQGVTSNLRPVQEASTSTIPTGGPAVAATVRVPKIFDAEKGLISSAELKAQRDRDAARTARQAQAQGADRFSGGAGRGGRGGTAGKPRPPTGAMSGTATGQGKGRGGMTLLQRPPALPAPAGAATGDHVGARQRHTMVPGGGVVERGEGRAGKGRRGGRSRVTPRDVSDHTQPPPPQVMLLQRPK